MQELVNEVKKEEEVPSLVRQCARYLIKNQIYSPTNTTLTHDGHELLRTMIYAQKAEAFLTGHPVSIVLSQEYLMLLDQAELVQFKAHISSLSTRVAHDPTQLRHIAPGLKETLESPAIQKLASYNKLTFEDILFMSFKLGCHIDSFMPLFSNEDVVGSLLSERLTTAHILQMMKNSDPATIYNLKKCIIQLTANRPFLNFIQKHAVGMDQLVTVHELIKTHDMIELISLMTPKTLAYFEQNNLSLKTLLQDVCDLYKTASSDMVINIEDDDSIIPQMATMRELLKSAVNSALQIQSAAPKR